MAKRVGVSGVVAGGSIVADVAEFDLGNEVGEFHGAVESGVLVGGEESLSGEGKGSHASQAVTFFGDEAVVKLDFPGVEWVFGGQEVDAVSRAIGVFNGARKNLLIPLGLFIDRSVIGKYSIPSRTANPQLFFCSKSLPQILRAAIAQSVPLGFCFSNRLSCKQHDENYY